MKTKESMDLPRVEIVTDRAKSKRTKVILINLAAVLFGAMLFAMYDLAPYFKAKQLVAEIQNSPMYLQSVQQELKDIRVYNNCTGIMQPDKDFKQRDCLVESLPKVKTTSSAIYLLDLSIRWLESNPDDEGVRVASLQAIENARYDMEESKMWFYDKTDQVLLSHDQSWLLRLKDGRLFQKSTFDTVASSLDAATLIIKDPSRYQ